MHWLVFSGISILALSVANLLQRKLMRGEGSHVVASSIVFQLFCAVLIGAVTLAIGFSVPPLREYWFNFVLMGVLYAGGTLFLFRSLQTIGASEATIVTASRALWAVAAGVIFVGDFINATKIIGIILVLGAVLLVSYNPRELKFSKGSLFAFLAAVCYGFAVANDSYILKHYPDVMTFTTLAFLFPGLLMAVFRPSALPQAVQFIKSREMKTMIIMSLFYSASAVAFYFAFRFGGTASQVSPVQQSDVILTVILAAIFLGERGELPKKIVGALMTIGGVFLLR